MDHMLVKLLEVDGADRGSIMVSEETDFVDGYKTITLNSSEPPLKPVRQFYHEQKFSLVAHHK